MKKILVGSGKKSEKEMANTIVQMFLPLDVDMQTLEVLCQDGGNIEEFLREMYSDEVDYSRKFQIFGNAVSKLLLIPDSDIDSVLLNELASAKSVESFFLKLSWRSEAKMLLQQNWAMDVFNSFNNINSFHDWYCALVNALRGGEINE